jgi:membrane-bound metal-dependent hydrolase YbcI (DUF457 family)
MPFTPLHLGAGAVLKGVLDTHFSFVVFAISQLLIDLEPLVRLLYGQQSLHGFSHTFIGAALVGIVATLTGKPIGELILRLVNSDQQSITWRASILGAFCGTSSHIFIDGIMHADMQPWFPLPGNPFLDLVSLDVLHIALIVSGVLGGIVVVFRSRHHNDA